MKASEEYFNIITEFISATEKGILNWQRQNPTTLYLETTETAKEKAIVSIQKVIDRKRMRTFYVFAVKNLNTNEIVIQIDSSINRQFQDILSDLFKISVYRIEKRNIDFLKGLMKDLKIQKG